jgi:hypothetical protein
MARGSNTGRGNYPASRMSQSAKTLKEGLKGIPNIKHPNRHMSSTEYKKTLKKEPESNE